MAAWLTLEQNLLSLRPKAPVILILLQQWIALYPPQGPPHSLSLFFSPSLSTRPEVYVHGVRQTDDSCHTCLRKMSAFNIALAICVEERSISHMAYGELHEVP